MKKTITYIVITLSVIFWGISFILTKELFLTEEHMTVTTLITLRLAIATAVMLPTLMLTRRLQRIRRQGTFLPDRPDIPEIDYLDPFEAMHNS